MNVLELFAGIGGGILASQLLGHRVVCAVELDPYCRTVLVRRQNDGDLPPFPIWDDVRTFDGRLWRGVVDVVSGGFPCQNISPAGDRSGITGEKSSLWFEMLRIVREVRPRFVFVENSAGLVRRGLDTVLEGLDSIGYDAEWCVLGASDVGAPHYRKRCWILAYANGRPAIPVGGGLGEEEEVAASHREKNCSAGLARRASADERRKSLLGLEHQSRESTQRTNETDVPDSNDKRLERRKQFQTRCEEAWHDDFNAESARCTQPNQPVPVPETGSAVGGVGGNVFDPNSERNLRRHRRLSKIERIDGQRIDHTGGTPWYGSREWWEVEPRMDRVADGVPHRLERIKALGNAQVPLCAATAWRILYERIFGEQ